MIAPPALRFVGYGSDCVPSTAPTGYNVWGVVFEPDNRQFFALTLRLGTLLKPNCGSVWSQTDPKALKAYIEKHCRKPN